MRPWDLYSELDLTKGTRNGYLQALYKRFMSAYFPTWNVLNEEREQSYLLTQRQSIEKNETMYERAIDTYIDILLRWFTINLVYC